MRSFHRGRLLLATIAVLAGLAGCASGAGSSADDATGMERGGPQAAARPGPTSAAAVPVVSHDEASVAERRSQLLDALRQSGLPVSRTGDREVRIADAACRLVNAGLTADDLAGLLTESYPVIPEAKARELARVVVVTYC